MIPPPTPTIEAQVPPRSAVKVINKVVEGVH